MCVLLKALNVKVIVILPKKKGLKKKIFFWMFFTIFFFIFFIFFFFFGLFFRWYKVLKNYVNEWLVGCLVLRHQNFNFLFISTICLPSCVKIVYNLRRHFYFYFFFWTRREGGFFRNQGLKCFSNDIFKKKKLWNFFKIRFAATSGREKKNDDGYAPIRRHFVFCFFITKRIFIVEEIYFTLLGKWKDFSYFFLSLQVVVIVTKRLNFFFFQVLRNKMADGWISTRNFFYSFSWLFFFLLLINFKFISLLVVGCYLPRFFF